MTDDTQAAKRAQIRRLRQLARRALSLYGIEPVSLSLLGRAYNTTFAVTGQDAARMVLHILLPEDEPLSERQSRVLIESERGNRGSGGADLHRPLLG